ncbi:MAG: AMP-binding protein [Deltaproteobacteria bacterium]|nr:AMP-binding protein [Deltaproteobacteria bacterium]MBW2661581.1 AMP-binding protein [Deltaproteobacteria bacterium]
MHNLSLEERAQIQLERLQSTLNRAYRNVPFHRNRKNRKGQIIDIDRFQVESIKDLSYLPFMERKHLGEYYPYGLFAVPLRDIVRIHTAPGTTLNPTVSGYTRHDLLAWKEMVSTALIASKVTAHDILQINLNSGLANWGRDYKDGAESIEAGVIPNTHLSIEKQLKVLKDYKTSVLITTPAFASQLAGYIKTETDLNFAGLNLKTLILVGEPTGMESRSFLEEQLHATTWLHYGLSEVPGPAIAFECEKHGGLHVNEDNFIPEIVDVETGELLPEGETGELILTALTMRAFPLIRFKTGDRARFIQDTCNCGCPFKRIEWLEKRTDDMFLINGVKVHQKLILLHIEDALGFVPARYCFFKSRQDAKNYLEVWIAVDDTLFSDEIKALEKLMKIIEDKLHENIGVPVSIKLKEKRSFQDQNQFSRKAAKTAKDELII